MRWLRRALTIFANHAPIDGILMEPQQEDAMAKKSTKKVSTKKVSEKAHPTGNTELCPQTGKVIPKQSEL
jgi:hypothetical protein